MNLAEFRTAIRTDLKATPNRLTDAEIDEAVDRAFADLDRLLPYEKTFIVKVEDWDVDNELLVYDGTYTGPYYGRSEAFTFHAVEPFTQTVKHTITNTNLTLNTDYFVDWLNGRFYGLKLTTLTALAAGCLQISYTKSRIALNIASLTDLIRVFRVEYPGGQVPQSIVGFQLWQDQLFITSSRGPDNKLTSQDSLVEDRFVVVYYQSKHTRPVAATAGTNWAYLDQYIARGAGAYCLLTRALDLESRAADMVAEGQAMLGTSTDPMNHAQLALDKIAGLIANIDLTSSANLIVGANDLVNDSVNDLVGDLRSDLVGDSLVDDSASVLVDNSVNDLVDDLLGDLVGTSIGDLVGTSVGAALAKLPALYGEILTRLPIIESSMLTQLPALHGEILTHLGVIPNLLTGSNQSAKAALSRIPALIAKAEGDLGNVENGVAEVKADLTSGANSLTDITTATTGLLALAAASIVKSDLYLTESEQDALSQIGAAITDIGKINAVGGSGYLDKASGLLAVFDTNGDADLALLKLDLVKGYLDRGEAFLLDVDKQKQAAIDELASIATDIETAYTNFTSELPHRVAEAEQFLGEAHADVDRVTTGRDPVGYLNQLAETKVSTYSAYLSHWTGMLDAVGHRATAAIAATSLLTELISTSSGEATIASQIISEAEQRIAAINAYLSGCQRYVEIAQTIIARVDKYLASATAYQSLSEAELATARVHLEEAATRLNLADRYFISAQRRLDIITQYLDSASTTVRLISEGAIAEAATYISTANSASNMVMRLIESGQLLLGEANAKVNEYNVLVDEAGVLMNEANILIGEANTRVGEANVRVGEANARVSEAGVKVGKANARIAGANAKVAEANVRVNEANARVAEVNTKVTGANARVAGANALVAGANASVAGANTIVAEANAFRDEAVQRISLVGAQSDVGRTYDALAERLIQIGDRFRLDAAARLTDYYRVLEEASTLHNKTMLSSVRQS